MITTDKYYRMYLQILKDELVPAMGCTEPVSLAYAAATARDILGTIPKRIEIIVSGNIIKNVKSVIVPNTNGMRGIKTAVAAGILAGDSSKKLEVISEINPSQIKEIPNYLKKAKFDLSTIEDGHIFDIGVRVFSESESAYVRIVDSHTNITVIEKNGEMLPVRKYSQTEEHGYIDSSVLSVKKIVEFADTVKIDDIKDIIERQISYNMAIAKEGLENPYGANIGKTLLKMYGDDVKIRAKAMAAAGSDARMNGCELPVIINSGSGNQGITASVPVIVYAEEYNITRERLYRALIVSNLCSIHIKSGIGKLSAYCGAVSAGCSCGAAITYMLGGGYNGISHTLVNSLAIVSGIVCDGAKASCAAKIAASVDAGLLGYYMYKEGNQFVDGDGIVKKGVENTISNIGILAHDGMAETDKKIIQLMID